MISMSLTKTLHRDQNGNVFHNMARTA